MTAKATDALLEIGTEEIPARFLPLARWQLHDLASQLLQQHVLPCTDIMVHATPRRLVLLLRGVPVAQEIREVVVLGPLKALGFDAGGQPTPAAEGFARKHGVPVSALVERPGEKGVRLAYVGQEAGKPAAKVLPHVFAQVVEGLQFPKSMRWPQSPTVFVRPIRWLLALLGRRPLKMAAGGLKAGVTTRGRRYVHPKPLPVRSAGEYVRVLKRAGIILDARERQAVIRRGADRLAARARGRVLWDEELLSEVADLVEAPVVILGSFPKDMLELPQPVLVAAMQEHQRYFPVGDSGGTLLPFFIAVSNGVNTKAVVAGNERVLKARLADAQFFYSEDRKKRLEEFLEPLGGMIWQTRAGTQLDKARRLEALAGWLAERVGADVGVVRRAALLCKADLVTRMVFEFPTLEGATGGLYAEASGEPAAVARAIAEHYRPQGPRDDIPFTDPGSVLALADKVDDMVLHFALGHLPTGTADPYGLRRAALGVIRIVFERGWRLSLAEVMGCALEEGRQVLSTAPASSVQAVLHFLRGRLEAVFAEQGFAHDEIQASLADFDDIVLAAQRLRAIAVLRHRPDFRESMFALSRVTNILPKDFSGDTVDPAALDTEERALYDAHELVRDLCRQLAHDGEFEQLYTQLSSLKPPIDRFFDRVLVMEKETSVRNRRLALLKHLETSIRLFADVRQLVIA